MGILNKMSAVKRRRIRQKLFEKYEGVCQLCFGELSPDEFSVIAKLKRNNGGDRRQTNMAIAHTACAYKANDEEQRQKNSPQGYSSLRFGGRKC